MMSTAILSEYAKQSDLAPVSIIDINFTLLSSLQNIATTFCGLKKIV